MTKPKISLALLAAISFLCVVDAMAQHGGKAEPNRIKFGKGRSSTTLTARLSNGQEMEYVFGAQKGQKVTVQNANTSAFDFRIFNDGLGVETEFESSRIFTLELPATGDYLLFVRKKVGGLKTATFRLTLTIK
jgi:hypothetical protein